MKKARLPKYGLHKATGQAVVYIDRKAIYLGKYDSPESHAKYDRVIAEWLAGGRQGPATSKAREITVGDLAARYIVHAESYYVKNGQQTDEVACIRGALRVLLAEFRHLPVGEFGGVALKRTRDAMIEADLCRRYINKQIGRIRRMFRWGVAEDMIEPTVWERLRAVDGLREGRNRQVRETAPVGAVSVEIVERTIEYLPQQIGDMVRLQLLTGCRPGEVRSIRPMDVDRRPSPWEYRPQSHKMQHKGRERLILIGPQAQDILRQYLLRPAEVPCFEHNGKPITSARYREMIDRATWKAFPVPPALRKARPATVEGKREKAAAITRWRLEHRWKPNQLRHTAATAIRQQFGLEAAQVVLGHAHADVTQVYAERNIEQARKVVEAVG